MFPYSVAQFGFLFPRLSTERGIHRGCFLCISRYVHVRRIIMHKMWRSTMKSLIPLHHKTTINEEKQKLKTQTERKKTRIERK